MNKYIYNGFQITPAKGKNIVRFYISKGSNGFQLVRRLNESCWEYYAPNPFPDDFEKAHAAILVEYLKSKQL